MLGSTWASMTYEAWEMGVPEAIRGDTLWKVKAYRLALFLSDLAWHDVTKLAQDRRTREIADQLYRAAGNISSSIGEGYSRGTGRDRARFYEYSLGSARETRDWYYKGRHGSSARPSSPTASSSTTEFIRSADLNGGDRKRIEPENRSTVTALTSRLTPYVPLRLYVFTFYAYVFTFYALP